MAGDGDRAREASGSPRGPAEYLLAALYAAPADEPVAVENA